MFRLSDTRRKLHRLRLGVPSLSMHGINARVRAVLDAEDLRRPGARHRAERVAVYAVAVGDQLGMELDRLVALRLAAELNEIEVLDKELRVLAAHDEQALGIVRLCADFDARRFGHAEQEQMTDAECVAWLKGDAISVYGPEFVNVLLAVQNLIQPIGT